MNTRAAKFVTVGLAGFVVQASVLAGLLSAGWPYVAATLAAVESAILHNFAWHLRWTWKERPIAKSAWRHALARFHASNGLASLGGNVLFTTLLVETAGQPPMAANAFAVALTAAINYVAADRWVFRETTLPG